MLPSILTSQLQQGVTDFLETTFPVTTPHFARVLPDFLRRERTLFRGPYLSLKLPFQPGEGEEEFFEDVPLGFTPYLHQERAFRRLGLLNPKSTLIATGTGSGKTEAFLYPVLNYCNEMKKQGVKGIKAIIIYPMNALASDQAGRIARICWNNEKLKHFLSVGLYVGQKQEHPATTMQADSVITERETLRDYPPDILLTNYKMLDFLLIRPGDAELWKDNAPDTLRYLVVDELHTFDGAQGTDLACLIRRLKQRLETPAGHLCCVGTSATLGAGADSAPLREYAGRVFGEKFPENAVITEELLSPAEFLAGSEALDHAALPREVDLRPLPDETPEAYLRRQTALWFDGRDAPEDDWPLLLGERLRSLPFFRDLIGVLENRAREEDELAKALRAIDRYANVEARHLAAAVDSVAALVSAARVRDGVRERPFLYVRLQLWLRELRRMVVSVDREPMLAYSDDLREDEDRKYLPLLHCRECGAAAWGGIVQDGGAARIRGGLQKFYRHHFAYAHDTRYFFPHDGEDVPFGTPHLLCPHCLQLNTMDNGDACSGCGERGALIRVLEWHELKKGKERVRGLHNCPYCGGMDSLTVLGSRAASLISVMNGQLFGSPFNDDKKVIAFSDSVQDASHRAGFFTARTYRFNFRTALQQCMRETRDIALADLPARFDAHWRQRMNEKEFITTFLPPDMEWLEEWDVLRNTGKLPGDSDFLDLFSKRIAWEILSEYGFSARIGRTLERSGVSIAAPDSASIDAAIEQALPRLRGEFESLRTLDAATLRRVILGFLTHMKNRGGILHPLLHAYVRSEGNTYLLNKPTYLPGFGPRFRSPVFLSSRPGGAFDSLEGTPWYTAWMRSCLAELPGLFENDVPDALRVLRAALTGTGLLRELETDRGFAWGIDPARMRVTTDVALLRCGACGHGMSAAAMHADAWEGMPCLRSGCRGRYTRTAEGADYYAALYSAGDVRRIVAREHTGLLERDEREELEREFRHGGDPWSPNLLSATPTLEMGVDIGDLSTVVHCSVPPGPANYIQRSGRAGRRNGSALVLTLAMARPHDLYHHAEPKEMIEGDVRPPGCYLNAPAVLERQMLGYCFDRWVKQGVNAQAIPRQLREVMAHLDEEHGPHFPHNFFSFVQQHRDALFEEFIGMFHDEVDDDTRAYLHARMYGTESDGNVFNDLFDRIFAQNTEIQDMRRRIESITRRIKQVKEDPAAGDTREVLLEELDLERTSLRDMVQALQGTGVYNFLTDTGFLPNYAFPETGITLRSIIYRHVSKAGGGKELRTTFYEYERPAAAAIRELAPDNSFYAGGRKVVIDQVNLQLSEREEWRFCPECSHSELETAGIAHGGCPRCGALGWQDVAQKHRLLRLRQVQATTSDRRSRSWDERDDREPLHYQGDLLVHPDASTISTAWMLENRRVPFGFEYVGSADFQDVNFGVEDPYGEVIRVAGSDLPVHGFPVCKHCGRVQSEYAERRHTSTCRYRDEKDESVFTEMLYLYREFTTEALRMLLPATSMDVNDERLQSFIAALYTGLREKFGGDIDHIKYTVMREPVHESGSSKRYLVLYDAVPGGTGYLKELMQSTDEMREVFELALARIKGCACDQDEEKDGCYRCVFSWRLGYAMNSIRRSVALELLDTILEGWNSLQQIRSIDEISVTLLQESELERRFLEALRTQTVAGQPVRLKRSQHVGKTRYDLTLAGRQYEVVPQVLLGESDGVELSTRADFVIYPADGDDSMLPIAVYTDGFAYHAAQSGGRGRVGYDLAQRLAIMRSGRYLVWSLTWNDVDFGLTGKQFDVDNYLTVKADVFSKLLDNRAVSDAVRALHGTHALDSFSMLLKLLETRDITVWREFAALHALAGFDGGMLAPAVVDARLQQLWHARSWKELDAPSIGSGAMLYTEAIPKTSTGAPYLVLARVLPVASAAQAGSVEGLRMLLRFFDEKEQYASEEYGDVWNGMLRVVNFAQFYPAFAVAASSALDILPMQTDRQAPEESATRESATHESATHESATRESAMEESGLVQAPEEFLSPEALEAFLRLQSMGCRGAVQSYELEVDGAMVAQAPVAWPRLRIALMEEEGAGNADPFRSAGWLVVIPSGFHSLLDEIRTRIAGAN